MKYLAAYALVALTGKAPTEDDVKAVLKAAHVPADQARLESLFAELAGKNFDEVCNEGKSKLVGAAPAAAGGAAAGGSAGGAPAAAAAAAAETKKDEPAEEEDDDMGFGLFD